MQVIRLSNAQISKTQTDIDKPDMGIKCTNTQYEISILINLISSLTVKIDY